MEARWCSRIQLNARRLDVPTYIHTPYIRPHYDPSHIRYNGWLKLYIYIWQKVLLERFVYFFRTMICDRLVSLLATPDLLYSDGRYRVSQILDSGSPCYWYKQCRKTTHRFQRHAEKWIKVNINFFFCIFTKKSISMLSYIVACVARKDILSTMYYVLYGCVYMCYTFDRVLPRVMAVCIFQKGLSNYKWSAFIGKFILSEILIHKFNFLIAFYPFFFCVCWFEYFVL